MATATFDTLKYSNALKAAGMPHAQVEVLIPAMREMIADSLRDVATKEDIREIRNSIELLRTEMKAGFDLMRAEMKNQVDQLRGEMSQLRGETKSSDDQLRSEMKNNVDQLRHEIRESEQRTNEKLALLKSDLTHLKWVVSSVLVGTVLMVLRVFVFKSAF
jgi:septal ring factor EnvC (AmiA/AmiB activator)